MKKNFIFLLLVMISLTLLAGCSESKPAATPNMPEMKTDSNTNNSAIKTGYTDLAVSEAKKLIESTPELVIIDVSPHYAKGHLPKAIHYYLGDGSLDKAIPTLDKDKKYLVYCHVDSVSIQGAEKLVNAGFKNVYRLQGNYSAWVDAGYPIEK